MTELVRSDVTHGVRGGIRVAVGVTVETGDTLMRLQAAAVLRQVELLLRERADEQPQSLADVLRQLRRDGIAVSGFENESFDLPDPDDEPFLQVALSAAVDLLVTGNIADFPPDKRRGCIVVSPADFMKNWNSPRTT